jgi:hypothetical protein
MILFYLFWLGFHELLDNIRISTREIRKASKSTASDERLRITYKVLLETEKSVKNN